MRENHLAYLSSLPIAHRPPSVDGVDVVAAFWAGGRAWKPGDIVSAEVAMPALGDGAGVFVENRVPDAFDGIFCDFDFEFGRVDELDLVGPGLIGRVVECSGFDASEYEPVDNLVGIILLVCARDDRIRARIRIRGGFGHG